MRNKRKLLIIIFSCVILFIISGYLIIGNPIVFMNNQNLKKSIQTINTETIQLNDIVPFPWDKVYTPSPYLGKEEIEKIIGFKSADIKENTINEGMVTLIFVKENKVQSSILGYAGDLGYSINFIGEISFEENAKFNVEKKNGIIELTEAKDE